MRRKSRFFLLPAAVLAVSLLAASSGFAQGAPTAFTNLQVLPKDISAQDIFTLMTQYSRDLGVSCQFCHEGDFAADTKPEKKTARVMINMVNEVNTKYLADLPAGSQKASCYTCHRGHSKPEAPPTP